MFKKILTSVLAASMLLMACSCGTGKKDSGDKVYVVATDTTFAPFEFQDGNDFVGIDMDLLKAIAEDQGFEYKIDVLGFNAAVQALEVGQCDAVIAGMSITEDRQKKFDFPSLRTCSFLKSTAPCVMMVSLHVVSLRSPNLMHECLIWRETTLPVFSRFPCVYIRAMILS